MPGPQANDITDIVNTQLQERGTFKFTSVASDIRRHVAFDNLVMRNRHMVGSILGVSWRVQTRHQNASRHVGLHEVDNVNIGDSTQVANVQMRHTTNAYGWDEREAATNAENLIVDILDIRRVDAMTDIADKIENTFWTLTAATDGVKPLGMPNWVVWNATSESFSGGEATGYSATGGIASATHTRWKNYSATYTSVTPGDMLAKIRRALHVCDFVNPVPVNDFNTGNQYGLYTTYSVLQQLENIGTSQNDNLGYDIAVVDGKANIRGNPITAVAGIENNLAGNPMYGINWGVTRIAIVPGEWLKEKMVDAPNQHRGKQVHIDCSWQLIVRDRRRNFVIATADPTA